MTTFVLVHGAWHGGWCWHKVVPLLESKGHRVLAPDLEGLGQDQTPLAGLSLAAWADSLAARLRGLTETVVLVGHSRGGIVISEVAERVPERISSLVYLTAFLPRDGEALANLAQRDAEATVGPNIVIDEAAGSCTVKDEAIVPGFYGLCSEADIAFAKARLRPEPLFGLGTPVHITADRFGSVKRHYIECLQDRAIGIATQRSMQAASPCASVTGLDSDHSPFFSMPEQLAAALESLSA
jgi:pimeloyl-ACP methyl ester carboxylesterase